MSYPSRRSFIQLLLGAGIIALRTPLHAASEEKMNLESDSPAPSLGEMIKHPLLMRSIYLLPMGHEHTLAGAVGINRETFQFVEEQRQGAEWIVRGVALNRDDWQAIGWRQLEWGLEHQQVDGGFGSKDGFHSTAYFVEALARSCILDPDSAKHHRVAGLARGAHWLMKSAVEQRGAHSDLPYTNRRFMMAAALGQAAKVTGEQAFARRALAWAGEGVDLQRADGTNPEKDGFDLGYQMLGVLMALRYLPVCGDAGMRARLRTMIRKATQLELSHQNPDGSFNEEGSTRTGKEHGHSGRVKPIPYPDIVQALVYGAQAMPEPGWIEPARRVAVNRKWIKA